MSEVKKHVGGRPLKYKTEKDLCDYLELNINRFCIDALDTELISYQRESFMQFKRFGANTPRVDFELETMSGIYLVECKNPTQTFRQVSEAISQLLTYSVIAEPKKTQLVLVTSHAVPLIQQAILKFELPIKVVYMNDVLATWDIDFEKRLNAGEIQVEAQYAIPQ